MFRNFIFHVILAASCFKAISSFTTPVPLCTKSTAIKAKRNIDVNDELVDRSAFFQKAATYLTTSAAFGFAATQPAWAKGQEDSALKGTKNDPKYQACVSSCVYECTKPKGDEQKSRAECIPECKKKCATSKEQLMIGTPVKN